MTAVMNQMMHSQLQMIENFVDLNRRFAQFQMDSLHQHKVIHDKEVLMESQYITLRTVKKEMARHGKQKASKRQPPAA
jgi:hypothetical protein